MKRLTIYNPEGEMVLDSPIWENCVHSKTLMGDETISYSFNACQMVPGLKRGCYCELEGLGRFELLEDPYPTVQDKGVLYQLTLYASWCNLKNYILFYDRQFNNFEASWQMTNYPAAMLDIVKSNCERVTGQEWHWTLTKEFGEMKYLQFDSVSIIDALSMIAEAWETEWWIDGTTIYLGKCEMGSAVNLEVGQEVANMSADRSQGADDYATRLYVYGSTRNLPMGYRGNSSIAIDHVRELRLQLPLRTGGYIDVREGLQGKDVVEKVVTIDDVYPRMEDSVRNIRTTTYTDQVENADGSTTTTPWLAYRIGSTAIQDFREEWRLEGEELKIQFLSGALAGMEFVVNYNPEALNESNPYSQYFEIIRNEDYGAKLPNDVMRPYVGDKFVMWGYDTTYVANNMVSNAEEELLEKGQEMLTGMAKDINVYTLEMNPIKSAGWANGVKDTVRIVDLEIGQRVKLINPDMIGAEGVETRILSYEKRLYNPLICTYKAGESSTYSRSEALKAEISGVSKEVGIIKGSAGGYPLITKYDKTEPSDFNTFSALRARADFARRNTDDTIVGMHYHEQGVRSNNFTPGILAGGGFELIKDDGAGSSYLEIDKLAVRKKATFSELEIKKILHAGGEMILSAASAKLVLVEAVTMFELKDSNGQNIQTINEEVLYARAMSEGDADAYICYFSATDGEDAIDNNWVVGDLARCQTFNLDGGQRFYWREVIGVSSQPINDLHYIILSAKSCDDGSGVPMVGDNVVQLGNVNNADRQNAISMASYGSGTPYLKQLKGINSFNLDEANVVTQLSPEKNIIRGHEISMIADNGKVQSIVDITDGIKQTVTNLEGDVSIISQDVDNIRLGVAKTGIDISEGTIVLNAETTTIDGELFVQKLNTQPNAERGNARIVASGNTLQMYDENGIAKCTIHSGSLSGELPAVTNINYQGTSKRVVTAYDVNDEGNRFYTNAMVHSFLLGVYNENPNGVTNLDFSGIAIGINSLSQERNIYGAEVYFRIGHERIAYNVESCDSATVIIPPMKFNLLSYSKHEAWVEVHLKLQSGQIVNGDQIDIILSDATIKSQQNVTGVEIAQDGFRARINENRFIECSDDIVKVQNENSHVNINPDAVSIVVGNTIFSIHKTDGISYRINGGKINNLPQNLPQ